MARTAVLEEPLSSDQAATLSPQPIRSTAQATIDRYTAHHVAITARTPAPGILILSDVFYPGWQVTVDGQQAVLLQVNHALRGVYLPAGDHSVTFDFKPVVFYVGLGVTLLTVLAVLVTFLIIQRGYNKIQNRGG